MFNLERRARKPSLLACLGALLAAASIGLDRPVRLRIARCG